MKTLLIFIVVLISFPAMAQDWDEANRENEAVSRHEQAWRDRDGSDDYQPSQTYQMPEPKPMETYNSQSPASTLYDCAQAHNCQGAFDP